jgi:hypothetical protein
MKLVHAVTAAAIAVISPANPANAVRSFVDGNWLFDQCDAKTDVAQLTCAIYIAGVIDGKADLASDLRRNSDCPPEGVVIRQLREIVDRYLEAHPERRRSPAASLVHDAVGTAFQCGW